MTRLCLKYKGRFRCPAKKNQVVASCQKHIFGYQTVDSMQRHLYSGFLVAIFISSGGFAQSIDEYLLWAKTSGFINTPSSVNQSDLDGQSNLYVIGSFYKKFPVVSDPTQTASYQHIFLRKYDADGNLQWSKEYGNNEHFAFGGDIRVDRAGDIVFTGYVEDPDGSNFGQPFNGFFICKANPNGDLVWFSPLSHTFLLTWGLGHGSLSKQSHLEIDADNSILWYSNGNPSASAPNPTYGLYISRFSAAGNLMNQYQITHDDNFDSPFIGGIATDGDGNMVITGSYQVSLKIGPLVFGTPGPQSNGPLRLFVAKFTATGDFLWAKYGGLGIGADVATDEFGNIYLTGQVVGHASLGGGVPLNATNNFSGFIAMLNPAGEVVWSKTMWGGRPISLTRTASGNLYLTGETAGDIKFEDYRQACNVESTFVMMIKPDITFGGAIVSNSLPFGYTAKAAHNSNVDNDGNVYTVGNFNQLIVFGCDTLISGGGEMNDMFITKFSSLPPSYPLDIDGPAFLCPGGALTLSVSPVPAPASYFWLIPNGVTVVNQSENLINISYSASTNLAEVNIMVKKGCYQYWNPEPYVLHLQFIPGAVAVSGQTLFCNPGVSRFTTITSTYATAYQWTLPESVTPITGTSITTTSYIDVFVAATFEVGSISVKGVNACGEGPLSLPLEIRLTPPPAPVSFIDAADTICNRGQAERVAVTPSEKATEYVWTIPSTFKEEGVVTTSSPSIRLNIRQSGVGEVTVFARNACRSSDLSSHTFSVDDPLNEPQLTKSNCDLELYTNALENLQWYKHGEKVGYGELLFRIPGTGSYYVTTTNFCGTVQSQTLYAEPVTDEQLFIPNVITPNNDGKNDLFVIEPRMSGLSVMVLNRWGNVVFQASNYQNDWDAVGLAPGVYYIQMSHPCLSQTYKGWIQVLR